MNRRALLASAAGALTAQSPPRRYRAAIIGHTGRGDYGHDWDTAWTGIPSIEVVAAADPNDVGRARAKARSGALRDYPNYREMLAREKPHLVAVCPRWLDQRCDMIIAAAETSAHILTGKPFAATLEEADRMVDAAARHRVKIQVGHTARPYPVTLQVRRLLQDGAIG